MIRNAVLRVLARLAGQAAANTGGARGRHPNPYRKDDARAKALLDDIMTPAGPGDPRRHHYIPQFFLRRFAEGDQLVLMRLDDPENRVISNVANLAVWKDMYTIVADDIGETAGVERLLSIIDGGAVEPLKRLSYGVLFPPHLYDRAWLSLWILLLHVRGPKVRRVHEALLDYSSKLFAFIRSQDYPDTTPSEARALLNDLQYVGHQNEYVRLMLMMCQPEAARLLDQRTWILLKFSSAGLILPDSPVILTGASRSTSVGIGNADEILLPLDRRTVLCLSNDQSIGDRILRDPSHITIEELNEEFCQHATSEIYCHPDDVKRLKRLRLPTPGSEPLLHLNFPARAGEISLLRTDGMNEPPERLTPRRYSRPSEQES